jgi:hypothetical protein
VARKRSLAEKKAAYRATFCGELPTPHVNAEIVLADLRRLCWIDRGGIAISSVDRHTDIYATMYRNGMRDVYLRIVKMIGLDATTQPEETPDGGPPATAEQ